MTPSDPFEERMRAALRSSASDPVDVGDFLADVHRGARRRRRRRTVVGTAAMTLLIAGGGFAVSTTGLLDPDEGSHVADPGPRTPESAEPLMTATGPTGHPLATIIDNNHHVSNGATEAMSVSSTGTEAQWALAATAGADCLVGHCATIFANPVLSDRWSPMGQLPLPAGVDGMSGTAVTQLRVAGSIDSRYDGWAYGGALLTTHQRDDLVVGASWIAPPLPVPGNVTALEAHGARVYAVIDADSSTLVSSPRRRDNFEVVDTGLSLGRVTNLSMSDDVVAFLNDNGGSTQLVSSRAGGPWVSTQPCASGAPVQLSANQDSLWVLCSDATSSTVLVSRNDPSTWGAVGGRFDYPAILAASSPTTALIAEPAGLSRITATSKTLLSYVDYTGATSFGFTNPEVGFLIDGGEIVQTDDGGDNWTQVDLTP